MNLADLLRAVNTVAQTGGNAAQCEALAREAENLADMVGWAQGPIDPQGQWLERLATLQDDLLVHYRNTNEVALLILNDTLTRLGRMIARHDSDLTSGHAGDDDSEDF